MVGTWMWSLGEVVFFVEATIYNNVTFSRLFINTTRQSRVKVTCTLYATRVASQLAKVLYFPTN